MVAKHGIESVKASLQEIAFAPAAPETLRTRTGVGE
jgi:hypothetical protein